MSALFLYDRLIEAKDICNFVAEIDRLNDHLERGRCVRLYGRRNFGKTSIVKNVAAKRWEARDPSRRVVVYVDFFSIGNLDDISFELTKAFNSAISRKRNLFERGLDWMRALKRVRPTWQPPTAEGGFGEFSIRTESGRSVVDFQDVITNIGNLTREGDLRFLIIFDEFQQIAAIPKADAKLRESLQTLDNETPVVVLGSKQHMLAEIFDRNKAPFASWGTTIELKEIPYDAYHDYIATRLRTVGKSIDIEASRHLQNLMDRIPESINRLCDFLADLPEVTRIDNVNIDNGLTILLDQTLSIYSQRYVKFTARQRLVLCALARRHYTSSVLAADFVNEVQQLSKSGIEKIVARMLDDSVVERIAGPDGELAYVISDPLFRIYIHRYKILLD